MCLKTNKYYCRCKCHQFPKENSMGGDPKTGIALMNAPRICALMDGSLIFQKRAEP